MAIKPQTDVAPIATVPAPKPKLTAEQREKLLGETTLVAEQPNTSKQLLKKKEIQKKAKLAPKSELQPEAQPKNGKSKVTYYENNLKESERKPQFVGTAISIPFFVEDYLLIKEAFDTENLEGCTTLTAYIRKVLLERAEAVIASDTYTKIANNPINMVTDSNGK